MKCEHCKVCITQAEADEAWNIREAAGASVELTLCPDCGQMEADAMEVEEFRAAFGGLDND